MDENMFGSPIKSIEPIYFVHEQENWKSTQHYKRKKKEEEEKNENEANTKL